MNKLGIYGGCLLFELLVLASTITFSADQVPENFVQLGRGDYFSSTGLIADKSNRVLQVWTRDGDRLKMIKSYPIDLGKNEGPKEKRNDHKTPEGIYYFQKILEGAGLDFKEYGAKAFTMNYPNLWDQREKKTGDGIWLHAVPDEKGLQRGSRGCVVVNNQSILDVGQHIILNRTPIVVDRVSRYITNDQMNQQRERAVTWLKSWLKTWQTESVDDYMQFYSDNFYSKKMNKAQWKIYKAGLASKYENIKIHLSEPYVVRHEKDWEMTFLQKYTSSNYEDFGEKTLYIREDQDTFKIIAEEFESKSDSKATQFFVNSNFSCCDGQIGASR